jgi:hypothetical protein
MAFDDRGIGKFLVARSIQDVTHHLCGDSKYSNAWIGAVTEANYDSSDVCPNYGTPRYLLVRGRLKPQRLFDYFEAAQNIEALHRHPTFRAEWKKELCISMNAYRKSLVATRLQATTNGEVLVADNGLYISMVDFETHDSKTQSVTSDSLLLLPSFVLLQRCVFYAVVDSSSCDLRS